MIHTLRFLILALTLYLPLGLASDGSTAPTSPPEEQVKTQAQTPHLPTARQVEILKNFFAKSLNEFESLSQVLPRSWLEGGFDSGSEISKIQESLKILNQPQTGSTKSDSQTELLALKLQFLKLSSEERNLLLSELKQNTIAKESSERASSELQEANSTIENSQKAEQSIERKLRKSDSEREIVVLQRQKELEKTQQLTATHRKKLAELRKGLSESISQWSSRKDEFLKKSTSSIAITSAIANELDQRIQNNNIEISSSSALLRKWSPTYQETLLIRLPDQPLAIHDTDPQKIKDWIHEIQLKRSEIETSLAILKEDFQVYQNELVKWLREYRSDLFTLRGQLLEASDLTLNQYKLDRSPLQILFFEAQTIWASGRFLVWTTLRSDILSSPKKENFLWSNVIRTFDFIQVFILLIAALFALRKRQEIIAWLKQRISTKSFSLRIKRRFDLVIEVIDDLYLFFLLFFAGELTLEALANLGLSQARTLLPYLETMVLVFFFWGLIDLLKPVLSQRRLRFRSNPLEVQAMEKTFQLIPKLGILYWSLIRVSEIFFTQTIRLSVFHDYFQTLTSLFFIIILLAWVRLQIQHWRLVCDRLAQSDFWKNILTRSKDRFFEPAVLLLGGGIGVYLLAWKVIRAQLSEFEIAKSFQAIVSRAILERKKRKSLFRIISDRFPPGYLNNFSHHLVWKKDWHVTRALAEEKLSEAYSSWEKEKLGTTVLISGDRGVGKSELIRHYLDQKSIRPIMIRLIPGDYELEDTISVLSSQVLKEQAGAEALTPEALIEKIKALPASVMVLENLENCILRKIGGFEGYSFLIDLILRTSGHHLWITTITPYAWAIIRRAVPGSDCFSHHMHLSGMSEAELKEMILRRHQSEKTYRLDFSSLSFQDPKTNRSDETEEDRRSNLFFRILWDYTDGNPRQALYFWKASLKWQDDVAKVDLFEVPELLAFDSFKDKTLMVLAALIEHNGLTVEGISEILQEPMSNVYRYLEEVTPHGVIYAQEEKDGSLRGYHIESFWIRATEVYLERRNLIFRGGLT